MWTVGLINYAPPPRNKVPATYSSIALRNKISYEYQEVKKKIYIYMRDSKKNGLRSKSFSAGRPTL